MFRSLFLSEPQAISREALRFGVISPSALAATRTGWLWGLPCRSGSDFCSNRSSTFPSGFRLAFSKASCFPA